VNKARVLAMALCSSMSVCLSVTSRCSIETDERIGLGFGMGASFLSLLCDLCDKLYSGRASQLGGIINLVDRRQSSFSRSDRASVYLELS